MSLRLTTRIIAPTILVSATLMLLGGVAAWYLHQLQQASSRLLMVSVARLRAAEELEIVSLELQGQLYRFLSLPESADAAKFPKLREDARDRIAAARGQSDSERERQWIAQIERGYDHFLAEFEEIKDDPHREEHRQRVLALVQQVASEEILQPARAYRDWNRDMMRQNSERNQAVADRMGVGLLLLGCCGAVGGLVVGYGIARSIQRSIVELTVPIRDAGGKLNEVVGPVAISSDATFQELESTLQDLANRVGTVVQHLQDSQRATLRAEQLATLGQLAAGLAHELRNPLTSIKLLLQPEPEDQRPPTLDGQDLAVLRHEVDRLEHTLQTFLDYARPPRLEKRPVVVRTLLQQTVEFVSPRARQWGVEIVCQCPEQVRRIEADAGQMRQVFLNLLLNALDASPSGSRITVRMSHPAAHWLVIEIADQGPGLPAEHGDRIFEPFVTTKEGGTGLGLPVCRRIMSEHGGDITAANHQAGGAVFTVRLPLTEVVPQEGGPEPQPQILSGKPSGDPGDGEATGDVLAPHWLPENVFQPPPDALAATVQVSRSGVLNVAQRARDLIDAGQSDIYRQIHGEVDQILLAEVLRYVQGNQVLASQRLGISRTTLRTKLEACEPDASPPAEPE